MAQVSHAASDFSSADQGAEDTRLGNSVEPLEDGKKTTLLDKVKTKAKATVRKLKDKVKKSPGDSDTQSGIPDQTQVFDSDDEPASQSPSKSTQSSSNDESKCNDDSREDNTEKSDNNKLNSDDNIVNSFARSSDSANSPLLAVPTNYSDPQATADVMPPAVIEPKSVSDEGEQSSSNLGEIPEAKEEERVAAAEVNAGLPDTNIGQVDRSFEQKDLEAIEGLPKPRGFDINDDSSFKSDDLRTPKDHASTEAYGGEGAYAETKGENNFLPKASDVGAVKPRETYGGEGANAETQGENNTLPEASDVGIVEPRETYVGEGANAEIKGENNTLPEASDVGIVEPRETYYGGEGANAETKGENNTLPEASDVGIVEPRETYGGEGAIAETKGENNTLPEASDVGIVEPRETYGGESANAGTKGENNALPEASDVGIGEPRERDDKDSNGKIPLPASTAEFHDSMFHSNYVQDLKPDEPPAAESNPESGIGTTARGTSQSPEKENYNSTQEDSGTSPAEFNDGMFTSNAAEPNLGSGIGKTSGGRTARPLEQEDYNATLDDSATSKAEYHDGMFSSNDVQNLKPNETAAAEHNPRSGIGMVGRGTEETVQLSEKEDVNERQNSRSSTAAYDDSMFTSKDGQNLNKKEPLAPELNPKSSSGTLSRGIEVGTNQSSGTDENAERLQDPNARETELHDYRSSSAAGEDFKPSLENESDINTGTLATEDNSSQKDEFGNKFEETRTSAPPETKDASSKITEDDTRQGDGTSGDITRSASTARDTDESQAESYFDAVSDEEVLVRQRSLDSDIDKDFNPEASSQYHEQVKTLTEAANSRFDAAKSGQDDNTDGASNVGVATESYPDIQAKTGRDDDIGSASNVEVAPKASPEGSTGGRNSLKGVDNMV